MIAQVPLLPVRRQRGRSVSPLPAAPGADLRQEQASPPAGARALLASAWERCAAAGRSADVLRGLAARGLVLLPGGHGAHGIAAVGDGVIRVDDD